MSSQPCLLWHSANAKDPERGIVLVAVQPYKVVGSESSRKRTQNVTAFCCRNLATREHLRGLGEHVITQRSKP